MTPPGLMHSPRYLLLGWRLMRAPGLRRFVWIPLLINMLVFGGLGWWLYQWAGNWLHSLTWLDKLPDWQILHLLGSLLLLLLGVAIFIAMAFMFTLLANLVGAPFNGLLAERVEAYLLGTTTAPAPPWQSLLRNMPRLMASEAAKLIYLVLWMIPLLLLQFVPLVNLIAPVLIFLFGAWMFALEYLDYPLGNHGALFRDVRQILRQRRTLALGFGGSVALCSAIPLINLFIMPAAVAGATALYVDHLRDALPATANQPSGTLSARDQPGSVLSKYSRAKD